MPPAIPQPAAIAERSLLSGSARPGALFFALLLAVQAPALDDPPYWDAAMSVFPAALTLAASGFDLPALLASPGPMTGGPNVHGASLVTWATAGLAAVLPTSGLLVVLHLLHLALAAAAAAILYSLLRPLLGPPLAVLAVLVALIHPLVLTQTAMVYLEVPLLLATTGMLHGWVRGRTAVAVAATAVAVWIKPQGLIATGALALAHLLERGVPLRVRLARGAVPLVAALPFAYLHTRGVPDVKFAAAWSNTLQFLRDVPDLPVILALGLLLAIGDRLRPPAGEERARRRLVVGFLCLAVSFVGFYGGLHLLDRDPPILPRYYVQLLPLALVASAVVLRRAVGRGATVAVLTVAALAFAVNGRGALYPKNDRYLPELIERSAAYRDLLALHRLETRTLAELAATADVVYGRPEHYRLAYPGMGYVERTPERGHFVLADAAAARLWRGDDPAALPGHFFVLLAYPWLGGDELWRLVERLAADPQWQVRAFELRSGAFGSQVVELTRRSPARSPATFAPVAGISPRISPPPRSPP